MRIRLLGVLLAMAMLAPAILDWTEGLGCEAQPAAAEPETVTYQTWFGGGTEVVFDHTLHLEMDGCTQCHHLEGCDGCHLREETPLVLTSAKVAIHGVCFVCHEQEPRGASCGECHQGFAEGSSSVGVNDSPQFSHAAGIQGEAGAASDLGYTTGTRPTIEEMAQLSPPEYRNYFTEHKATVVSFPHEQHAEGYGLECAACHHLEKCGQCHGEHSATVTTTSAQDALHGSCIGCHAESSGPTDCEDCHKSPRP